MNKKIKPLKTKQIIISLDRLTRFKPTEEKYLRVFKDIIISNLIYPKFKKNHLDSMNYKELTKLVEEVFNYSLTCLNIPLSNNYEINKKLLQYEKSVFKDSSENNSFKNLVDNKIDYKAALTLINNADCPCGNIPLNLKWLKSLKKQSNQIQKRTKYGLKFPITKIILVEGITEEILLPKFALKYNFDFNKAGIHLISAGGKKQVVKLFYQYSDILNLPVFVLLDNDAKENFEEIKFKLRTQDKVYVLKSGEFEDLLPLNLIKRALNKHSEFYSSVLLNDLRKDMPMTRILEDLFKERKLEFKKAEFASLVYSCISSEKDISEEIKIILEELKN